MNGYQYEKKCAELLKRKGFTDVRVTPGSGDQGIDVIAYLKKKKYGVQCKYYEGTVGNKAVQEVFAGAAYYNCDVALVITNSTLTKSAKALASKLKVEVWENIDAIYLQQQQQQMEQTEKRRLVAQYKEMVERQLPACEIRQKVAELRPLYELASDLIAAVGSKVLVIRDDGTVVKGRWGRVTVLDWEDVIKVHGANEGFIGVTSKGIIEDENKDKYKKPYQSWGGIVSAKTLKGNIFGLRYDGTISMDGDFWENSAEALTWTGIEKIVSYTSFYNTEDFAFAGIDKYHRLFLTRPDGNVSINDIEDVAISDYYTIALRSDGTFIRIRNNGTFYEDYTTQKIDNLFGIVKVYTFGKDQYALLSNGSLFVCYDNKYPFFTNFFKHYPVFDNRDDKIIGYIIDDNKLGTVVALSGKQYNITALTEDGKIHQLWFVIQESDTGDRIKSYRHTYPFGEDFRAFHSLQEMEERIKNIRFDPQKYEEEERKKAMWRRNGLCQHCGGKFKGIFFRRCSNCLREKDYY